MKKFLFTMLAVVFSTAMFAQLQKVSPSSEKVSIMQKVGKKTTVAPTMVQSFDAQKANVQKRADASQSTYYTKPSGSLYGAYDKDGYSSYYNMLYLPAFNDALFTNKSPNPTTCKWTMGGTDMSDYGYVEANGDFYWYLYPSDYLWYCPTLWNSSSTESYIIPSYYEEMGYPTVLACVPELMYLGFNNPYYMYTYGWLDNEFVFGTGTFTTGGYTYTCTGVCQYLPKPITPLYFDEVVLEGMTYFSDGPLRNGAELTMRLYDITNPSAPVLYATLTATNDDWKEWTNGFYGDKLGGLTFTQKDEDPLFGTTIAPVTMDCPTEVLIYGFDDSNVSLGLGGEDIYECDPELSECMQLVVLPSDPDNEYYFTYTDLSLTMSFHALLDQVLVANSLTFYDTNYNPLFTQSGYNVLIFSDDGKTAKNDVEDEDYDLGCIVAETACPWYNVDNTSEEDYYFEGLPDWITGYTVDTEDYVMEESYNNYIFFTAEALPSGTDYRSATVYLHGRGVVADTRIYLLQGNIPEGIEGIPAEATTTTKSEATYNLAGQRVSDSTKGIVIRDGKKFIAK